MLTKRYGLVSRLGWEVYIGNEYLCDNGLRPSILLQYCYWLCGKIEEVKVQSA